MGSLGKYILLKDTRNAVLRASVGNSLQLWLDASDSSTITESGGKVSQWDDKSGNGHNVTQGTGSAQPTTGVTTHNGKNVIDWDGGDGLELPSGLFSIPNGNHTIFMVSKRSTETASLEVLLESLEVTSGKAVLGYSGTSGVLVFRNGPGPTVSKSGATNTDFQIIRGRRDGTTQAITFNNGTEATNTSAASESSIDSMTIGKAGTGANLIGSIAEILIYNRSLSTTEIRDIERYLATKWNIGISAPDNIGGLQLWLDANDSSTITESGGKVSQWDDKSGNGSDGVQGTGSKQPTVVSAAQNGKSALDFDGGDTLILPSAIHAIPNGSNTAFIVVKRDSEDATVDALLVMEEGTSSRYLFTYNGASGAASFRSNDATFGGVTITGGANTDFQIFCGRREGTTQAIAINGGAEVTNTNGADEPNIDGAFVGSAETALFLNGQIAEIIVYNRSLSATERSLVNTYLANKYGITLA